MPELPEVETVARGLAVRITGAVVEGVHLARADMLHGHAVAPEEILPGRRVNAVRRCGKHVRIDCDAGVALLVHLGMTGRLSACPPDRPVETHTHLRITFRDHAWEMRFIDPRRFGALWLIAAGNGREPAWRGRRLPADSPDPLQITPAAWAAMMARKRQIKALLLDQQPISGVGNIYCDEALHRAGIHPLAVAAGLDPERVRRLHRCLRAVLREAIRAGGSSVSDYRNADDARGWFQIRHRVYGRAGQPCRTCGTPIVKTVIAGRGTHFCPVCQRKPRRRRVARG